MESSKQLRQLVRTQLVPLPRDETFAFFAEPSNLEAITPPWLRFRILSEQPVVIGEGTLIDYRLVVHRVPVRWRTRIERWEPDVCFVDTQVKGPYALWEHTHAFEEHPDGTLIHDRVEYRMPLGAAGALMHRLVVARDLDRIFDYRRAAIGRKLGTVPAPADAAETPRDSSLAPTRRQVSVGKKICQASKLLAVRLRTR